MNIPQRLDALVNAAQAIGITVEKAPMGGEGGGLAVLAGKRRLFVDTMADSTTAYENTLNALAGIEEWAQLDVPADVKEDIANVRRDNEA